MKIYCGRSRYNPDSDEEILDSLIGKDLWVRVKSGANDDTYWIRPVDKDSDSGMYLANHLFDYCEAFDEPIPQQSLKYKGMFLQDYDFFALDNSSDTMYRNTTVVKPVKIVTTEEIFI